MKTSLRFIAILSALVFFSGCARLLGSLRPDLNDDPAAWGPTSGGMYPEGGYLDIAAGTPAHYDRSPASLRAAGEESSWSTPVAPREAFGGPARDVPEQPEVGDDRLPATPRRATRNDFVDQSQDTGSLWASNGETNFFFSKNRARSPGDIITITIEDEMLRDIRAEVKRTMTTSERRRELELLEDQNDRAVARAEASGAGSDRVQMASAAPEEADLTFAGVDVSSVVGVKAGDTFLAEIAERYPNGNYRIRGSRRIPYRNTTKLMTLVGIVRGNDLGEEKITSGRIYEYRLQVVR